MKSNIIPGKKVPFLQLDTIEGLAWSTNDNLNKKNSMIIKVSYSRMGNWEYRLKNFE